MEAARAAVSKITGRTGHRTDVDEVVNPAVTSEVIKPHRHEETTEAIDREVHQHHYHTTVQPIQHQEIIPEKHIHNIIPQVEREFKHDNEVETARRVNAELGQFKSTSVVQQTRHTTEAAPQVIGEHVHHHVHETVQPVIHKETIQPEVVHTTVPIHETHYETAQHHGMSALPMKTLDEFTRAGGIIGGTKSHTHEEYEGAPRPYNEKLKTTIENVLPGHHGSHTTSTTTTTGVTGTGLTGTHGTTGTGLGRSNEYNTTGSNLTGTTGTGLGRSSEYNTTGSNLTGTSSTGVGSRSGDHHIPTSTGPMGTIGSTRRSNDYSSSSEYDRRQEGVSGSGSQQKTKPSLIDKLNPMVDANGDGKAGFMK